MCIRQGGFLEARGVYVAAALAVICHRCSSSPPTALLAMNSACSHALSSRQNDTLGITLQVADRESLI